MSAPVVKEEFFSAANLFWGLGVGVAIEVAFLGIGVTPLGMELGATVAETFGMIAAPTATAGVNAVTSSTGVAAMAFG